MITYMMFFHKQDRERLCLIAFHVHAFCFQKKEKMCKENIIPKLSLAFTWEFKAKKKKGRESRKEMKEGSNPS